MTVRWSSSYVMLEQLHEQRYSRPGGWNCHETTVKKKKKKKRFGTQASHWELIEQLIAVFIDVRVKTVLPNKCVYKKRQVHTTLKSRFWSIHSCPSLNSSCRPMMYRVSKASTMDAPSWELPAENTRVYTKRKCYLDFWRQHMEENLLMLLYWLLEFFFTLTSFSANHWSSTGT